MGRLTSQERQRVFLARETATRERLTRVSAGPAVYREPGAPRRRLRQLLTTTMIVTLLGGGWFAYHGVVLHRPASIIEALVPRL